MSSPQEKKARSFSIPVALNAIGMALIQLLPLTDLGVLQKVCVYFSIPYWVVAVSLGLHRPHALTLGDSLILLFGQLLCIGGGLYFFRAELQ